MPVGHPLLDYADELVRTFGVPALLGGLIWAIRTAVKGIAQFKEIDNNTKLAVSTTVAVKAAVETMQTNHVAHLQSGIDLLGKQGETQVTTLASIDKGISVLVDRGRA